MPKQWTTWRSHWTPWRRVTFHVQCVQFHLHCTYYTTYEASIRRHQQRKNASKRGDHPNTTLRQGRHLPHQHLHERFSRATLKAYQIHRCWHSPAEFGCHQHGMSWSSQWLNIHSSSLQGTSVICHVLASAAMKNYCLLRWNPLLHFQCRWQEQSIR